MVLFNKLRDKIGAISNAISRFPVVFFILIYIAVIVGISIEKGYDYSKQVVVLVFTAFCFLVASVLTERFGKKIIFRIVMYAIATGLTIGYHLLISPYDNITLQIGVKTTVAVFALLIAFIWVPSIKGRADFNDVFMNFFKSVFTCAFFSAIIWGGISAIIAAINALLVKVDSNAYAHTANIIWVVWAPMLMLSLIPVFSAREKDGEKIQKASSCPKFLEVLLSYVLIPLCAVYTLVLILYIIKIVSGGNWTANLLEPLIISYCISVLMLYILVSKLENRFTNLYKMIFPKILVPIAIFQIVSSIITAASEGIVHTAYFVIMFSLYSAICGIWFCIKPVNKNGMIGILAIVFSVVCIAPYVNAFSVSYASQKSLAINTLEKNKMLSGNKVKSNANISDNDKLTITKAVTYFDSVDKTEQLKFLPEDFDLYYDFKNTFGFAVNENAAIDKQENIGFSLNQTEAIDIGNYDYLANIYINMSENVTDNEYGSIERDGQQYRLLLNINDIEGTLSIADKSDNELISVSLKTLFINVSGLSGSSENGQLPAEELTFDFENSSAKIRVIFRDVNIYNNGTDINQYGDAYVLFIVK